MVIGSPTKLLLSKEIPLGIESPVEQEQMKKYQSIKSDLGIYQSDRKHQVTKKVYLPIRPPPHP